MRKKIVHVLTAALVLMSLSSFAVASGSSVLPTLHLSASAQTEVRQDWLLIRLHARHQASEAAVVQRHLQALQDRASTAIRPETHADQFQFQTGNFSVYPRYGRDGKIQGWEGESEIILQGRDMPHLTRVAANLTGWSVAGMHFELSRQTRQQTEQNLMQEAIAQFNAKAQAMAKGFGFKQFDLHEVHLNAETHAPMPSMLRMSADGAQSGQPQPLLRAEPGLSPVSVNLSGAVRLRQ